MIVKMTEEDIRKPLTDEEKEMLENLKNVPIVPDEDCPFLSEEELKQFHKVSEKRKEDRAKQPVTIRISRKSLDTAKSLGKGYTSILARMLENDLSDKNRIKQFL